MQVYERKHTFPFGLEEADVLAAHKVEEDRLVAELLEDIQETYPYINPTEHSVIFEVLDTISRNAIARGMALQPQMRDILYTYSVEKKKKEGKDPYDFKEAHGVCGVLTRDGKFYKCLDTQHNLLLSTIEVNPNELIYFSSKLDGVNGVVSISPFGNQDYTYYKTDEVMAWYEEHKFYFDTSQTEMFDIYFLQE